jgi:hypothetical protein
VNTSEPQSLTNTTELFLSVKRGFLVWSWIGLLGAFITTSSTYGNFLFLLVTQGARIFEFTRLGARFLVVLFFPAIFLSFAWVQFYFYSTSIYRMILFPESESAARLFILFRLCLVYLISSWVVLLLVMFAPYLLGTFSL